MIEFIQKLVCCEEENILLLKKSESYPNYLHEVDLSRLPSHNKETQTFGMQKFTDSAQREEELKKMSTEVSEKKIQNSVFSFGDNRVRKVGASPLSRHVNLSNKKKWGGDSIKIFSSGKNDLHLKLRTDSAFKPEGLKNTRTSDFSKIETQDFSKIISQEQSKLQDESEMIEEEDDGSESTPSEKIEILKNSKQDHVFSKMKKLSLNKSSEKHSIQGPSPMKFATYQQGESPLNSQLLMSPEEIKLNFASLKNSPVLNSISVKPTITLLNSNSQN